MINILDILLKYKAQDETSRKKLVFCNIEDSSGFQFTDPLEFEHFLEQAPFPIMITDMVDNASMEYYNFFFMQPTEPYLALIKHPPLTNAYFKTLPDKFLDSYVSPASNVYRYLYVNYGKKIDEYVVELPEVMDDPIYNNLHNIIGKNFFKNNLQQTSLSLVFTNSNRYTFFEGDNFMIMSYLDIYKDWNVKKITSANISKKLWVDIKKTGATINV